MHAVATASSAVGLNSHLKVDAALADERRVQLLAQVGREDVDLARGCSEAVEGVEEAAEGEGGLGVLARSLPKSASMSSITTMMSSITTMPQEGLAGEFQLYHYAGSESRVPAESS